MANKVIRFIFGLTLGGGLLIRLPQIIGDN
jgi:hypothetical protein